jgi:prepilin-type N-terminal cleavage/methylation domain-containing protein
MKNRNKNGFTLVELAIVLVVVGLITAGVVGGSSLIESSKRQAVISDIQALKTAVNAFKLEYDGLPGDFDEADLYWDNCAEFGGGNTRCNGNGDNKIVHVSPALRYESYKAIRHLALADLIDGNYTGFVHQTGYGVAPVGAMAGKNTMPSSYGRGGYLIGYNSHRTTLPLPGRITFLNAALLFPSRHYIGFGGDEASLGAHMSSVVDPRTAEAIDKKVDDGIAWRGSVISDGAHQECVVRLINANPGKGWNYNPSYDEISCKMYFDIGKL